MSRQTISIVLVVLSTLMGCSRRCRFPSDFRYSRLGVNLAGAEFGTERNDFSNRNPGKHGKDYLYPDAETIRYFASHGFRVARIPFRWERIQPRLGQPLDSRELARLESTVRIAAASRVRVILDLHNYARYRLGSKGRTARRIVGVIDERGAPVVGVDELGDVWRRLAIVFRGNPAVAGYGIMNEPHDLPEDGPTWRAISRRVVDAIRAVDPCTPILVSGDHWASARRFPEVNGPDSWIDPDVPNIVYEAHLYFDHDGSGKYALSYEANLRRNPDLPRSGVEAVQPFLEWCERNRVQGFIGEFGVPPEEPWLDILDDFLRTIRDAGVGGCYWAAGPWWGDYPLSIQPKAGSSGTAPQLDILKRHVNGGRQN